MLGGIQLGLLVEVPLCEIESRVYGACSLGVLVEVPRARGHAVWRAVTAAGHVVGPRVVPRRVFSASFLCCRVLWGGGWVGGGSVIGAFTAARPDVESLLFTSGRPRCCCSAAGSHVPR